MWGLIIFSKATCKPILYLTLTFLKKIMSTEIPSKNLGANNDPTVNNRQTGFYWIRIYDSWFLTKYYSQEDLFYFPGHFDGVDPKELHEIDERKLDKKFEGYKRKTFDIAAQTKPARLVGYYWVLHDAMWFAAYYLSLMDEFYFPGQVIGFDTPDLDEIDEKRIERIK